MLLSSIKYKQYYRKLELNLNTLSYETQVHTTTVTAVSQSWQKVISANYCAERVNLLLMVSELSTVLGFSSKRPAVLKMRSLAVDEAGI